MRHNDTGFSKRRRLVSSNDFSQTFKKQRLRTSDDCLSIIAAPNDADEARLGLAIAKKAIRTAVGRNRIKRLARESFRKHRADLPPIDIVVMARAPAGKRANKLLLKQFSGHWQRLSKKWQASHRASPSA